MGKTEIGPFKYLMTCPDKEFEIQMEAKDSVEGRRFEVYCDRLIIECLLGPRGRNNKKGEEDETESFVE